MADKSDIVLEEDTLRILSSSSGESPVVDIEGGNHWNLSESDGDVRIGKGDNQLAIGVSLGGLGEGTSRIRAKGGTEQLKLGAGDTDIVNIRDDGTPLVDVTGGHWNLREGNGDFRIGDDDNMLKMGVSLGDANAGDAKVWATSDLKLGSSAIQSVGGVDVNGSSVAVVTEGGNWDGAVRPYHRGNFSLGTSQHRWQMGMFEEISVDDLDVDGNVQSNLVPVAGGEYLPAPSLGTEDQPWNNLHVRDIPSQSDRRLKTDIETLDGGLDAVLDLRPVSYTWRENGSDTQLGLVAQEVADIVPEVVSDPEDGGYLGVDYTELVAVLVDAVQDQQAEREALEDRVEEQQGRIEELEERLDALEKRT